MRRADDLEEQRNPDKTVRVASGANLTGQIMSDDQWVDVSVRSTLDVEDEVTKGILRWSCLQSYGS